MLSISLSCSSIRFDPLEKVERRVWQRFDLVVAEVEVLQIRQELEGLDGNLRDGGRQAMGHSQRQERVAHLRKTFKASI